MPDPLDAPAPSVPSIGRRQLVLVDGRTFATSDEAGEMRAPTHGLVHDDLRHLSRLHVTVDDDEVEVLAASAPTALSAVVVGRLGRATDGAGRGVMTRRRWVAGGLREEIHLRNPSNRERSWTLRIGMGADFAHVFDVKAGLSTAERRLVPSADGQSWRIVDADHHRRAASRIVAEPGPDEVDLMTGTFTWHVSVPARAEGSVCLTVEPEVDGVPAGLAFPCGTAPSDALPVRRMAAWRSAAPTIVSPDPRLALVVDQALADIAALRITDPDHVDRVVVAAGAPWFMTLFGRDSLLTAWMTLPFDARLAAGVLASLAELQGTRDDPVAEEQPGKILHELRRQGGGGPFIARQRYYGTVDATPLFVMLAAEAWRWGALTDHELRSLGPAVDAAVGWILGPGDADGDGFLDYERRDPTGLSNQGWKDSWDGVTFADGSMPTGPIALAEVQGYAYAALLGAAELAAPMGLSHDPGALGRAAADLRSRFNVSFWDQRGWFAMGLDGAGRRIDSLTTNPGHALWTGIAAPDRADEYLDRLVEPSMWTGWGLRTLADTMEAYDPLSYHNGSVWPHDTAICVAGAARYGRWDVVDRLTDGALDAATEFAGRPPELFSGISRTDAPMPVAYPASCSPQAWSSASVLLLVRSLIGLTPSADRSRLEIARADLSGVPDFRLERIAFAGGRTSVTVRAATASVLDVATIG